MIINFFFFFELIFFVFLMVVAENRCLHGVNKWEWVQKMDMKGLLMMDIVGENMGKKTFLVLNIQGEYIQEFY